MFELENPRMNANERSPQMNANARNPRMNTNERENKCYLLFVFICVHLRIK